MFLSRLSFGEKTEIGPVIDVQASPMCSEGCHVMSVEASDGPRRRLGQSRSRIWALSELDNIHLTQAVTSHGVIYPFRNRSEIFADKDGFVPMRFEAENGVK